MKDPLKIATTLVGLLAGLVVGVYLLGGLVIALRLLFDDYDFNAVVVVLGQLPREPVIATALLDVIGPAVAFGLLVALFYGARDRPKPRPWGGDELDEGPGKWPLRIFLPLAAVALCAWSILEARATDGVSVLLVAGALLGIAVTLSVLAAVWFLKRRVARLSLERLPRAAAVGGLFALVALTPAVMTASAYPFERAVVCTTESQVPQRGLLIGEGGGRILIELSADGEANVVSVPLERAGRTEFGDVQRLPCPLPASQAAAAGEAEAALGGHGSKQEVELAMQVRPFLMFDTRERWRPLEVESFLRERFPRSGGAQRLCYANGLCEPAHGTEKLHPGPGAPAYVDIQGSRENGTDFHSPHPHCLASPPAVDCNDGPLSVIYYRRTTHEGRWYWDFWVFYRYNDYTGPLAKCNPILCSDHEGDWEGVTVITSPSLTPTILGVIYAAHRNRILVEAGNLPSLEGHPLAFVAEGTHATYPYRCSEDCHQYADLAAGVPVPEDPHDGTVPWGGNSEQDCVTNQCVRPFPEIGEPGDLAPPLAGGWAGWPGAWGATCQRGECGAKFTELQGSPASPGTQPRFRCPWAPTDESPRLSEHGGLTESEPAAGAARSYATCARRAGNGL